ATTRRAGAAIPSAARRTPGTTTPTARGRSRRRTCATPEERCAGARGASLAEPLRDELVDARLVLVEVGVGEQGVMGVERDPQGGRGAERGELVAPQQRPLGLARRVEQVAVAGVLEAARQRVAVCRPEAAERIARAQLEQELEEFRLDAVEARDALVAEPLADGVVHPERVL